MSKDLSRITAVKKSLDWAREAFFFKARPLSWKMEAKNSSWTGDFSFYPEGQQVSEAKE